MEAFPQNKRIKRSAHEAALTQTSDGGSTIRSSFQFLVLEQQVRQLEAELEHERSLRKLDEKRSEQAQERLKKQIELSEKVAQDATTALEDYRTTSEVRMESLRESYNETLQQLRECEIQLMHYEEDRDEDATEAESNTVKLYQNRCKDLENLLAKRQEDDKAVRANLEQLREELQSKKAALAESKLVVPEKTVEEADPAILKELHRIRMSLATSQRQERQLQHKVNELEKQNSQLIKEREELRRASQRLPAVQQQLDDVHGQYVKMQAEHDAWKIFGKSLRRLLHLQSLYDVPPEISAVESAIRNAGSETVNFESLSKSWQQERQNLESKIESKTAETQELVAKLGTITKDHAAAERKSKDLQSELDQTKIQRDILQREVDSLRGLVKTFDGLPLASAAESKVADVKSPLLDTSKRTLQVTLDTTQEQLRAAQVDNERLRKDLAAAGSELDRVKEKFGKLKEALQEARVKTSDAEKRAADAEALAGKGSFDPSKSRVLHLTETPLVEILKEEVKVLKRQIEASKGSKSATKASLHNPDKLNQRLKENFKEQIATFREGVYLMTGLKIDMLPNTDRPTFRVRSLYSASEQDHLLLKWPRTPEVSSLDLLNTDFAKVLSTTPSYQYMTRFQSLPAFLASVQLSLFENSTQMVVS
jgi:chromosome segregation ATPase